MPGEREPAEPSAPEGGARPAAAPGNPSRVPSDEGADPEALAAAAVAAAEEQGPLQGPPAPAAAPDAPVRRAGGRLSARTVTLTALETAVILMFLLIEPTPRWVLLFGSGIAALSMDGILRAARRDPFESGADTTPYLFLPALWVLAVPIFIEHNLTGYWVPLAGVGAGLAFGAVAVAEVASVREHERAYGAARFVATSAAYFVAFAVYSLAYTFDLGLQPAIAAAALVSLLLGIEILREGEVDPLETLVFAAVAGLVVAEVRWTLYYLPLDGYLAGVALLLAFYFVTGLMHSHLTRHLNALVAAEYVLIAGAGVALVAGARAAGIA